ncbi:hypothetical protein [Thalassobacillus sp. CUG 92003]|uniref:hypothetical protein n=1 Tax=Thalassobacillus sp. CUG 92003 TaxID=2736641 RepID=UPI0015E6F34D|nr:hypothetical protein [Thalassobacillus sp. CUG 92003]
MLKYTYGFITVSLITLAVFFIYENYYYDVELNAESYQQEVARWLKQGHYNDISVEKVHQTVQIEDSKTFVSVVELKDESAGFIILEQGVLGEYKFTQAGFGSSVITCKEVKTTNGKFMVVAGKNPNQQMAYMKGVNEEANVHMRMLIPDAPFFITYKPLPSEMEEDLEMEKTYYNEQGHEIAPEFTRDSDLIKEERPMAVTLIF